MSRIKVSQGEKGEVRTPEETTAAMLADHLFWTYASPEDFRDTPDRTDLGLLELKPKEATEFTCGCCWLYKGSHQQSPTEPGTCRDCTGENDQPEAYTVPPSKSDYL